MCKYSIVCIVGWMDAWNSVITANFRISMKTAKLFVSIYFKLIQAGCILNSLTNSKLGKL
jgi:hypothetical protein